MFSHMSENNTKAVFDATASTYDRDRSKLIPRLRQLLPLGARSHPSAC